MKLKNVIKLKFLYLINKTIIIVFALISFIIILTFLLEGINANQDNSYKIALELYNQNSYMYLKVIMTFFSVYLFSYSISFKNDFLIYLLLPIGVSKLKSFFSTIIVNVIIIYFMFCALFVSYNLIGVSFIKIYSFELEYILIFSRIYLVVLIYGLYAMILMQLLNNNFTLILIIALFVLSNNYYENNELNLFIVYLLPNVNTHGEIFVNAFYLLIYALELTLFSYYLYNRRDLNY